MHWSIINLLISPSLWKEYTLLKFVDLSNFIVTHGIILYISSPITKPLSYPVFNLLTVNLNLSPAKIFISFLYTPIPTDLITVKSARREGGGR